MFYLEDTLTVHQGEVIRGQLNCTPNPKNPRDLDISIHYTLEGKDGNSWDRTQDYRLR